MKKKCTADKGFPLLVKILYVMKIALFLIVVSTFSVCASSLGQNTKLNLTLENSSVHDVLKEIESISDYFFFYQEEEIDLNRKVDLKMKNANINQILDYILDGTDLKYKVVDRYIVINTVKSKSSIQQAEKKKVSGTVTDNAGESLPGVSVVIKGTTIGTVTDFDGKFTLDGVSDNTTLVFSFVGMKTEEISVDGQSVFNVKLQEDAIGLEEVVAVGYGVQKKVNLTGSVATINREELVSVPVANTAQSLAGKLPGLVVKESTGKPGAQPSISIRGFGSPLIIVDGIEQSNYGNIDPNEIESFSVLKDASAAVYGAKAGNGVILITTKRGSEGKPTISINSSINFQGPTMYPDFVDSWELAVAHNEIEQYREDLATWQGKAYNQRYDTFSEEDIAAIKNGSLPSTNWFDVIMKDWSPMQTHNVNVSGSGKGVKYFISAGYVDQDGFYKSSSTGKKRYNVRSNVDIDIAQNLTASLDLSVRRTTVEDVANGDANVYQTLLVARPWYPESYPDPTKMSYTGWDARNPISMTDSDLSGYNKQQRNYFVGALKVRYNFPFIKGLNAEAKLNYINDNQYQKVFRRPFSSYLYDKESDTYSRVATENSDYYLKDHRKDKDNIVFQMMLNYDRKFGDHGVKGLLVGEYTSVESDYITGDIKGFISPAVDQIFAGNSETKGLTGSAYEEGNVSYVGRLNYDYLGKYLVETTFRADASSRFHKDVRWGFFPSVALGWRISEENFLKNAASFLDNAKLRLSYSQTGFDRNANAYQYLSSYGFDQQYVVEGNANKTLASSGLVNKDVTWEMMETFNAGIDLTAWNGLLGVEFDYFYRLRDDILGTRISTLPNTFGATLPQENLNSIDTRGFELSLNHKNNINYSIGANVSWNRSKYKDWEEQEYEDEDEDRIKRKSGNWTNRWFGYETTGYFQTQDEIANAEIDYDNSNKNKTVVPGFPIYVDQNDDKVIDWRDQVVLGKGNTPEVMFGFDFSCDYKGFDFSMLWQGATNYNMNIVGNLRTPIMTPQMYNIPRHIFDRRWSPDNPNAEFPRLVDVAGGYLSKTSDMFLRSARYLRLKNISFGYTLPKKWIATIGGLRSVRVYCAGYNMFTFNNLKKYGIDTERGGSYNGRAYPMMRSFSFGVNIKLQ
ncbi:SusC/RagA family TonB-linked outer membrane protein [Puteibacter caeruleilacunae]|nr:SusC/RagA family TonB-linked outer membrane protein [Puteibacter caeruleilacunae]